MRDVMRTVSKIVFYLIAGVILLWTAGLTLSLAFKLLPGETLQPFFILVVFDGGALAWCLTFLFSAQGLAQRAISLLLMIFDLVGVITMSIAALFLSGQQLTSIPDGLGALVVWGAGIWTAANLVAVYAFHVFDPTEMSEIRMRSLQDAVTEEAMRQVEQDVHIQAQELAAQIAIGMKTDVLARLRLPTGSAASTIIEVPPAPTDTGRSTSAPVLFASDVASAPEARPADIGNPNPTQARTR